MFELKGKYASAVIYADQIENEAMSQIVNICNQPMFEGSSIRIMPDCHSGKGSVIGFTARLAKDKKMIIPNIVGVDIGCGVLTTIFGMENEIDYESLDDYIRKNIPSGFSVRNEPYKGIKCEVEHYIIKICNHIGQPIERNLASIGTLGGGNHYIELGKLEDGKYALSIHTGSRNLGKQVCEFYQNNAVRVDTEARDALIERHKTAKTAEEHIAIQEALKNMPTVPKELAYVQNGYYDNYITDMLLCKCVAAENRRVIAEIIMKHLKEVGMAYEIEQFDTVHNYVDIEEGGYVVIRKGAISAYKGQRLAIPLNMRDGVVLGIGKGNPEWNLSAPHGAGRLMSRSAAKAKISLEEFEDSMKGINTWSVQQSTIDESPMAYKPAETIIEAIKDTVDIYAIVKPIYNFKAS